MEKDVRLFAIITSLFPTIWLVTFVIAFFTGVLYIGHIPVYGIDNDPYSLDAGFFNLLYFINLFTLIIGFLATPGWLFLIIHLFINKIKFTRKEITYHFSAFFSLLLFLVFYFFYTSPLNWFYD